MTNEIKLPKEFTEEHKSLKYYSKLVGKQVIGCGLHGKIIEVLGEVNRNPKQDYPDAIIYKTETREIKIDWIIMVQLIEGSYAKDAFGYEYRILE